MREINWDEPLSDEDRAWAVQHDRLHPKIQENEERFGGQKKGQTREERIEELKNAIGQYQQELAMLESEQAEEMARTPNYNTAGDPNIGQPVIDNTEVNGQTPQGAPAVKRTYDGLTGDQLRDEIDKRNEERQEAGLPLISKSGRVSELVERLQKDDEEIEAED